ncbi:hypothetical protein NPIL_339981 [Nephila pilipes]|uniref:Uncharacterized protein n=1 Tax=Nephila pilipes TaxID=299642 RepID=A0A8X6TMR7_NEPPI|nr:hypothetical protein NPIL_339981 [Nephila pilipes]
MRVSQSSVSWEWCKVLLQVLLDVSFVVSLFPFVFKFLYFLISFLPCISFRRTGWFIERVSRLADKTIWMMESVWNVVLSSDESKFNLTGVAVCREVGKDPRNTVKTVKYAGGSVLFWAVW